ncbi:MAG: flavodoxin family protein [Dehalococcoidia bacterium]
MSPSVRVAIAYHSGYGHTAKQAEAVARGVRSLPDAEVELLSVDNLSEALWQSLAGADAIIFGAPTYMGGPSGVFKTFADESSTVWFTDGWKDKIAAGFTNSGHMHGDKLNTLVYFAILAAQHGMHWVNLGMKGGWDTSEGSAEDLNRLGSWLGAMAQSNKDQSADVAPPESDLRTAEALGRRVAAVTRQWVAGRVAAAVVGGIDAEPAEAALVAGAGARSAKEASHA